MSTLKQRRVRLLLVGALVAIRLVVPGASKAQDVHWAPKAHASAVGVIKSGMVLGGFTSQGWPVVLELSRKANLVIISATGLDMTCTSGDRFPVEDGWQLLTIARNGRVNASEQIPPQQPQPGEDTLTGGSHSVTGHLDRRRSTFRGTWRMQLNFTNTDGSTDTCQSGPVTFTAAL